MTLLPKVQATRSPLIIGGSVMSALAECYFTTNYEEFSDLLGMVEALEYVASWIKGTPQYKKQLQEEKCHLTKKVSKSERRWKSNMARKMACKSSTRWKTPAKSKASRRSNGKLKSQRRKSRA